MSEWENPIEQKWTKPVKEQVEFYIRKIYTQGYNDALQDIAKENSNDE